MDLKNNLKLIRLNPLVPESWPDDSLCFGLMIQVSEPSTRQLHAAALYRFSNRLMIGDLQNHLLTRRAEVRASCRLFWIAPDISQEDQRILAATIDAWLDENENKIPYSVAHPGGVIFKDNVWVGNEPGQGLTCSTFIMGLFNELGIPFINVDTWKARNGDAEWAEGILKLISHMMSPEHVAAQQAKIGHTVRVRPADIAAAGHLIHQEMETPLHFDEVAPLSASVEAALLELN